MQLWMRRKFPSEFTTNEIYFEFVQLFGNYLPYINLKSSSEFAE